MARNRGDSAKVLKDRDDRLRVQRNLEGRPVVTTVTATRRPGQTNERV